MTHPSATAASLPLVGVPERSLAEYRTTLVPGMYDELVALGERLAGLRVLHLSATSYGGGVAEIMYTLIPLMRDLGVEAEWRIIEGSAPFFDVTKLLHNSLQGDPATPSDAQWATWRDAQESNAHRIDADAYDVIVAHDPQTAGLAARLTGGRARWLWRCHIDLSSPNPETIAALAPDLAAHDLAFFHRDEYVPGDWAGPAPRTVAPAIDPLNIKNMALSRSDAEYVVRQFGIDPARPLLLQVSRFDPWKDPLGVIDAWRVVREAIPGLQLALVGSMASDDPEGQGMLDRTLAHAAGDPDVHVLTNLDGVGAVEVNAFQVAADVVLQKSLREGFGLTVAEALWKERPIVAGAVGGIRSQVEHGVTGWLVSSVEEAAAACLEALRDPAAATRMALAGKAVVRERFLMPRYLRDHLLAYAELAR